MLSPLYEIRLGFGRSPAHCAPLDVRVILLTLRFVFKVGGFLGGNWLRTVTWFFEGKILEVVGLEGIGGGFSDGVGIGGFFKRRFTYGGGGGGGIRFTFGSESSEFNILSSDRDRANKFVVLVLDAAKAAGCNGGGGGGSYEEHKLAMEGL